MTTQVTMTFKLASEWSAGKSQYWLYWTCGDTACVAAHMRKDGATWSWIVFMPSSAHPFAWGVSESVEPEPAKEAALRRLRAEAAEGTYETPAGDVDTHEAPAAKMRTNDLLRAVETASASMAAAPWVREQAQDGEVLPDGTGSIGDPYDTNTIVRPPVDGGDLGEAIGLLAQSDDAEGVCVLRNLAPELAARTAQLLAQRDATAEAATEAIAIFNQFVAKESTKTTVALQPLMKALLDILNKSSS